VLQTEHHLVSNAQGSFWCFCIKYLDEQAESRERQKVDYKQVLDEATFQRFSKLRETRKEIATKEVIPAYAVFTDEELAELAKLDVLTAATMRSVKGVGEKKVEKYGAYFFSKPSDEHASQ
jgi:superfamily II DNA helicase RecQ